MASDARSIAIPNLIGYFFTTKFAEYPFIFQAHAIHGKIQQSKKTITDSGFAVYVNVRKFSISSNEPMQLLHI